MKHKKEKTLRGSRRNDRRKNYGTRGKIKREGGRRKEREESTTAAHHKAETQSHVSTIEQGKSGTPDFPPLSTTTPLFTAFPSSCSSYKIKYYRAGFLMHLVCVFKRGGNYRALSLSIPKLSSTFQCVGPSNKSTTRLVEVWIDVLSLVYMYTRLTVKGGDNTVCFSNGGHRGERNSIKQR